jgi:hypothetical protein
MTAGQIVQATYRVAHGLNEIKHARRLIGETAYRAVDGHLRDAQETLAPSASASTRRTSPRCAAPTS